MNPIPLDSGIPQMKDYASEHVCTWCDGCGDYGIWTSIKRALVELKINPWETLLCFDVGCHGNMSDKIGGYRAHGLHGRVIPFAAGAKLANMKLPVIAVGGDGASFSEGVGHLVHAVRSNYPIVFILHNNANYGLTTGQASALTPKGQKMNTSPNGIPERTLPSMDFVFSLEPTFVARGFSGNMWQLKEILKAAIQHRGFAFVDVLQACPTYNHFATHDYLLEHCYDCWKEGEEVHTEMVVANLHANSANAQKLMRLAVPRIAKAPLEPAFSEALKGALFTAPEARNKATLKKLDLLVRKYL